MFRTSKSCFYIKVPLFILQRQDIRLTHISIYTQSFSVNQIPLIEDYLKNDHLPLTPRITREDTFPVNGTCPSILFRTTETLTGSSVGNVNMVLSFLPLQVSLQENGWSEVDPLVPVDREKGVTVPVYLIFV